MMQKTDLKVSIRRCQDYKPQKVQESIETALNDLGGGDNFIKRGDNVLIKPNFIAAKAAGLAVQTHPEVVIAVCRATKDCGAEPFVADSPAWGNVFGCIKALELDEPLRKMGVEVRQLDQPQRILINRCKVGVSKVALEADKIINVPKFKAHQQMTATFAVKNMYGCVCGKEKAYWHFARGKSFEDFSKILIGIYKFLRPAVTIIDGVTAMEGMGPIRGNPRELGFFVAGIDPIACELLCCELIELNPNQLPIIQTAKKIGFGPADLSETTIIGDNYQDYICRDFAIPQLTPLFFSLRHVCQSVSKQIIFLCKEKLRLTPR